MYESLLAFVLGVAISLGYALAGQLPGGTFFADALLRGADVGGADRDDQVAHAGEAAEETVRAPRR